MVIVFLYLFGGYEFLLVNKDYNLGVFQPVVCMFNCKFYWIVVTRQCGAMFTLCK